MGEQRNIDRLFREKFKDFHEAPDDLLWSKIENSLDEKQDKNRRIIPFWWRLGGIAAALVLLFTLGYNMLNSDSAIESEQLPVTETQDKDMKPANSEEESEKELFQSTTNKDTENAIATSNDSLDIKKHLSEENTNSIIEEKVNSKNLFPSKNDAKELIVHKTKETPLLQLDKQEKNSISNEKIKTENTVVFAKNETDENKNTPEQKSGEKKYITKRNSENEPVILKTKVEDVIVQNNSNKKEFEKDTLASEKLPLDKDKEVAVAKNEKEDTKTSIFDAIAEKEALNEEEEKNTLDARWSINPAVAPVYYNTIGEGSPIHSQFADNSKAGNINMSYGINVAYEINDRLSIRSGVNRVNYGYDTDDIAITSQALQAAPIATISYANTTANLKISDRPRGNSSPDISREVIAETPGVNGVLTQELGYLEVPLELKYRLVDKKLGVNVIGGFSSLFLTDNSISVASNNLVTNVGEANNINTTSFSTNIGFGVDYKLSNKIILNLEPIFKYQLNTFSSEDGGFRPYTIGVYTGLSFRF